MTLDEAINVLCRFHTRDDWQIGYVVEMMAAPAIVTPFTQADYIKAWGVLREHIHLPVTGHFKVSSQA